MSDRQQIYDRIRALGSKDRMILQEMIRKGFWKPGSAETAMPDALLAREAELLAELRSLNAKQQVYADRDKALKAMRHERLRVSREKQKETKARREEQAAARAAAWQKRKADEILHLGDEASSGLNDLASRGERLAKWGLVDFHNHRALAQSMAVTTGELRFLAYGRKVSKISHYRRFLMPKKRGGHRLISAPMPRLKQAQRWILVQILEKVALHDAAHGFRQERSILTNASPHCGAPLVINLDLRDFFPNVSWKRVYGLFLALGYSRSVATIFAQLCTEPPIEEVEMDGETWQVATGVRHLPQGAPTSPAITNLLCRRMDARMSGIARKHGFAYTRYADDLTFSSATGDREGSQKLLWQVKRVIEEEGFQIHPDKLRIMGKGRRREVTGLIVGEKPSVPREDVRAFRALLNRLEKHGPAGCSWRGETRHVLAKVMGYANYLRMVDAERYAGLGAKADTLLARHGFKQEIRHPKKRPTRPPPLPGSPPPLPQGGFLKKVLGWFGKKG
jgi:retron-type reverse transcriptase